MFQKYIVHSLLRSLPFSLAVYLVRDHDDFTDIILVVVSRL